MDHCIARASRAFVASTWIFGCGGQLASLDDTSSSGGTTGQTQQSGGATSVTSGKGGTTPNPTGRGGAVSSTSPTEAECFGQTTATAAPGCTYFDLNASGSGCLMSLPIPPNYKLNPAKLTLYFPAADGSRALIPYVGTLADCASHRTYGGWYATNITGGSSEIGLCGCTCNAARKYTVRVEIACDGIPSGS